MRNLRLHLLFDSKNSPTIFFSQIGFSGLEYGVYSQLVNAASRRPSSKLLAPDPEYDTTAGPEEEKAHVCHERRHVSRLLNPRCYKLRDTVSPNILVDSNRDENRASYWFVRIDSVSGCDSRKCSYLDARTSETDDGDSL